MSSFMHDLMFVDRPAGRSGSAKIEPKYDQAELNLMGFEN
jgi:hypothetical protein